jgi:hypothetical protein
MCADMDIYLVLTRIYWQAVVKTKNEPLIDTGVEEFL